MTSTTPTTDAITDTFNEQITALRKARVDMLAEADARIAAAVTARDQHIRQQMADTDMTVEQMWANAGAKPVHRKVQQIITALAPSGAVGLSGMQVAEPSGTGGKRRLVGWSFDVRTGGRYEPTETAEQLLAVCNTLRLDRDKVLVQIIYIGAVTDPGLDNGKTQHYLEVAADGTATLTEHYASRTTALFTGSLVDALTHGSVLAYAEDTDDADLDADDGED